MYNYQYGGLWLRSIIRSSHYARLHLNSASRRYCCKQHLIAGNPNKEDVTGLALPIKWCNTRDHRINQRRSRLDKSLRPRARRDTALSVVPHGSRRGKRMNTVLRDYRLRTRTLVSQLRAVRARTRTWHPLSIRISTDGAIADIGRSHPLRGSAWTLHYPSVSEVFHHFILHNLFISTHVYKTSRVAVKRQGITPPFRTK